MPYLVILSETFQKDANRLSKKYRSIADDILKLVEDLEINPTIGTSLGRDCYKVRMAISSKKTGKSGSSRVITCVKIKDERVNLLTIYDKSERENISERELTAILKKEIGR